jgi:ubiquinone/menaquinone biosynthesis C-methylase UbiE
MAELTGTSKLYADACVSQRLSERSAVENAAFLLPHLKPGMSLLDAGSGPGSITCGLAHAVAPGQVIGIDIEATQVERATKLASEQGVTNVRFQVGSAYDLPVAERSVDVVFAHTLLNYLPEPARALNEFRRVLKSGGLVAIRERDISTMIIEPASPVAEAVLALVIRYRNAQGNQDSNGRRLRGLLLEAGFSPVESFAFGNLWGGSEYVAGVDSLLRSRAFRVSVTEHGWTDDAGLEQLLADMHTWGQRPEAFAAMLDFGALGWVAA